MERIFAWINLAFSLGANARDSTTKLRQAIEGFEELRERTSAVKAHVEDLQCKKEVSLEENAHAAAAYKALILALHERRAALLLESLEAVVSALETGTVSADLAKDVSETMLNTRLAEDLGARPIYSKLQAAVNFATQC